MALEANQNFENIENTEGLSELENNTVDNLTKEGDPDTSEAKGKLDKNVSDINKSIGAAPKRVREKSITEHLNMLKKIEEATNEVFSTSIDNPYTIAKERNLDTSADFNKLTAKNEKGEVTNIDATGNSKATAKAIAHILKRGNKIKIADTVDVKASQNNANNTVLGTIAAIAGGAKEINIITQGPDKQSQYAQQVVDAMGADIKINIIESSTTKPSVKKPLNNTMNFNMPDKKIKG